MTTEKCINHDDGARMYPARLINEFRAPLDFFIATDFFSLYIALHNLNLYNLCVYTYNVCLHRYGLQPTALNLNFNASCSMRLLSSNSSPT